MKYIVGIDEVGRGPLAGPVSVCVVVCQSKFYTKLKKDKRLPPLGKDSKKLSLESRQKYSNYLNEICRWSPSAESADGDHLQIQIVHISNTIIDKKGLSFAIKYAIEKGIKKVIQERSLDSYQILLDGGLKAPKEFVNQKTIIKGDEKEQIIAWASILAKVSRDAIMVKSHKKFPEYGFHEHKGYGTKKHREAIKKFGLSKLHRKSFCKNCIK